MEISKDILYRQLMYDEPVSYNEMFSLYPIQMEHILDFQVIKECILARKNSWFAEKKIIKMTYLEFLFYVYHNQEFIDKYTHVKSTDVKGFEVEDNFLNKYGHVEEYLGFALSLLHMACRDQEVRFDKNDLTIKINGHTITSEIFDDIRRIIIIQNDIDFDIDEFVNRETEEALKRAAAHQSKIDADKTTIEDYIDSVVISLRISEKDVQQMSIRKFFRYLKRINMHDEYIVMRTGESSGFVKFKEPLKHWTRAIDEQKSSDMYKADESKLKEKIQG